MLATGSKVGGFLMSIKINSITSFERELKREGVPYLIFTACRRAFHP
jgi:hypothetical protein